MTSIDSRMAWMRATDTKTWLRRGGLLALGLSIAFAIAFLMGWIDAAGPRLTAAPAGAIEGFRSAHFGADEAGVRAAIASDFGKSGDDIRTVDNSRERTRILLVRVTDLFPNSGDAEVGYVFGYQSQRLIQVNVLWGTPVVASATPADMGRISMLLQSYFGSLDLPVHVKDRKLPNGGLIAFQGVDGKGHSVQLLYRAGNIKPKDDAGKSEAAPKKFVMLRLAYVADPKSPDIFKLRPGAF